jgi:hypothetical protein
MNKIGIISIIMLALCLIVITPVHGKVTMVTKDLTSIENCYNVTISYKQTSGNTSDITFPGCKKITTYNWTCDCHNVIGEYNLTMSSDGAILKKPRVYDFNIDYRMYDITKFKDSFVVRDYGYELDIGGMQTDELGRDIQYVDRIIYVNNTVYKDKIINNITQVIKEVEVDNITTITRLNGDIIELQNNNIALQDNIKQYKSSRTIFWITIIVMFLIICWLTYLAW